MDRYSYVYGTLEDGMYSRMDGSEDLGAFLASIKVVNPGVTEDLVRSILGGIKKLEGYENYPGYDAPLAVRYAPMHLYKRPDMPKNMEPFCAMCISGEEQREGRSSVYSQVFFIGREDMQTAPIVDGRKITYLDQLFGFEWLTAKDMDGHRSGKYPVNFDMLPAVVMPQLRPQDQLLVFQTVRSIYEDKSVVIRVENNCSFNNRAKQLLIQIYSMMQPRLATEIGFASYQDPAGIQSLAKLTSTRIFLVPAACKLPAFGTDFVVFDLEHPETIPGLVRDGLNETLYNWSKLPWSLRQQELETVFADTVLNYMDKNLFQERTKNYFENEFLTWQRSSQDVRSVDSLESLRQIYERFPILETSEWCRTMFRKKLPALMKKPELLKQITAQAAAQGFFGPEAEKRHHQALYLFAAEKLNSADPLAVGMASGRLVQQNADIKLAEKEAEGQNALAALRADCEAKTLAIQSAASEKIKAVQEDAAAAIASAQNETAQAIAKGEADLAAAKAAADTQITQIQTAAAEKITQIRADAAAQIAEAREETAQAIAKGESELAAERDRSAQALSAVQAAAAAAVAAEQQNTDRVKAAAKEAILQEKQNVAQANARADAAAQQFAAELDAHSQTRDMLGAAQVQLTESQQECSELKSRLNNAAQKFQELKQQKMAAEQAAAAAEAEVRRLATDRQKLDAEMASAAADRERLKQDAHHLSVQKQNLDDEKKRARTIGIAIGFSIGAVLFGVILALILLLGDKPVQTPAEETTLPVVQTETTEVTIPETTVAETQPEPDFYTWTEGTADWLMAEVPGIVDIETNELAAFADKDPYHGFDAPLAVLYMDSVENYAVLMQVQEETPSPTETEAAEIQIAETEISESQPVEIVETSDTEKTESVLCLSSGDLHLVVYGDNISTAVNAFGRMIEQNLEVRMDWSNGVVSVPVSHLLQMLNLDWSGVSSIGNEEEQLMLNTEVQPLLQVMCDTTVAYIFEVPETLDSDTFVAGMNAIGYNCFIDDGYAIAVPAQIVG